MFIEQAAGLLPGAVRQGENEFRLSDVRAQITKKIQIAVHRVLVHVFRDFFIQKQSAHFLPGIISQLSLPSA